MNFRPEIKDDHLFWDLVAQALRYDFFGIVLDRAEPSFC